MNQSVLNRIWWWVWMSLDLKRFLSKRKNLFSNYHFQQLVLGTVFLVKEGRLQGRAWLSNESACVWRVCSRIFVQWIGLRWYVLGDSSMDLLYMDLPGKEGFVRKIQLSLTKNTCIKETTLPNSLGQFFQRWPSIGKPSCLNGLNVWDVLFTHRIHGTGIFNLYAFTVKINHSCR